MSARGLSRAVVLGVLAIMACADEQRVATDEQRVQTGEFRVTADERDAAQALGLQAPVEVAFASSALDGGSMLVEFADVGAQTLSVCFVVQIESPERGVLSRGRVLLGASSPDDTSAVEIDPLGPEVDAVFTLVTKWLHREFTDDEIEALRQRTVSVWDARLRRAHWAIHLIDVWSNRGLP